MEIIEFRAVISFVTKQGKRPQTILEEIVFCLRRLLSWKIMVYKLHKLFKQGGDSLEDDPRLGRPIVATTAGNIEKVGTLVLEDACLKYKQLTEIICDHFEYPAWQSSYVKYVRNMGVENAHVVPKGAPSSVLPRVFERCSEDRDAILGRIVSEYEI